MKAQTAAKAMGVLLASVVVTALGFHLVLTQEFQKPQQQNQPIPVQAGEVFLAIKQCCELDGIRPRNLADLAPHLSIELSQPKLWDLRSRLPGTLTLNFINLPNRQRYVAKIVFKPKSFLVKVGEWIKDPQSQNHVFQVHETQNYPLFPSRYFTRERAFYVLSERLDGRSENEWKQAISLGHTLRIDDKVDQLCEQMQIRFPDSHWAQFAKIHVNMSRRKNPNNAELRQLIQQNPNAYAEWFSSMRLNYLSKPHFYRFAKVTLPKVPPESRDHCYEEVVKTAYSHRDFDVSLIHCERWNNKASARLHAASCLAAGTPKAARFVYEKHMGSLLTKRPLNSLEAALILEDTQFRLPDAELEAKPFFTDLADFLIFPDLN